MGQYHYICNLDKHEYLNPHSFGEGVKLMEFGMGSSGTLLGLAVLLAASNGPEGRGGGDWRPWTRRPGCEGREVTADPAAVKRLQQEIPGRWAGNRIAVIGDYAEAGDPGIDASDTPWAQEGAWTDISADVVAAIELDYYVKQERDGVKPW